MIDGSVPPRNRCGVVFSGDIFEHCIEQCVLINAVVVVPWPFIHPTDCAHARKMCWTYGVICRDHRCLPKLAGSFLIMGPNAVVCGRTTHMSSM